MVTPEYLSEVRRKAGSARVPKGISMLTPEQRSALSRKAHAAKAAKKLARQAQQAPDSAEAPVSSSQCHGR